MILATRTRPTSFGSLKIRKALPRKDFVGLVKIIQSFPQIVQPDTAEMSQFL